MLSILINYFISEFIMKKFIGRKNIACIFTKYHKYPDSEKNP